jgi:hypothetical protein
MKTGRLTWIGVGIMLLLGIGAVSLTRAQQASEKRESGRSTTQEARERYLKLKTEVDVLQMEYDAARATLVEWLRDAGKAELAGIDVSAFFAEINLGFGTVKGPFGDADFEPAPVPAPKPDESSTRMPRGGPPTPHAEPDFQRKPTPRPNPRLEPGPLTALSPDLVPRPPNRDDPAAAEEERDRRFEADMNAWSQKTKDEIAKRLERLKKEFAQKARELNEKKLELAEAEKQYQREAR